MSGLVAVIDAPSPKLRQEGGPAAWVPQGGRSTFRRHAAHDRRAKDEQHCIDHDPIRNHVAFLLRTNMSGRVEARWQARCDGRHTTVGFPLQRNPSIGARFRSNLPAPMISSETSATFRIRRPVSSPAAVQRPADARRALSRSVFTMSNSPLRGFHRAAPLVPAAHVCVPGPCLAFSLFLFCPFACRRISARLTDAAAGLSPSPWRQRPARPLMRGGWSADRRTLSFCRACEARRPRFRGADLSRCDRDPSRRSTVAIFGRGPLLPSPAVGHRRRQRCVGAKPRRLGGRDPGPPGAAASRRRRGTPLPAPPSASSPETPLMSEDGNLYSIASRRSQ